MNKQTNITIAKYAGFCHGVKRAIDEIGKLDGKNINILGPPIHNPQMVERLEKKGIKSIKNTDNLDKNSTVVVSAHGMSRSKIKKMENDGYKVVDLICPLVRDVHHITVDAEKKGYHILIFGDKNHKEVLGVKGNLKNVTVIDDSFDVETLDKNTKYFLVAQTTQNVDKFNQIIEELRKSVKTLEVVDTICAPTKERQSSALELAKKSDVMIVVGGKISANTSMLGKRCSDIVETHHVETKDELKKEWFSNKKHVGITAGASTPDWIIEDVIDWIRRLK